MKPARLRFQENSLDLIDFCQSIIPTYSTELGGIEAINNSNAILSIIGMYVEKRDTDELVSGFIDNTYNKWEDVKEKDRDNIIEYFFDLVISKIPLVYKDMVTPMINIVKLGYITDEDEKDFWRYIESLVRIKINIPIRNTI